MNISLILSLAIMLESLRARKLIIQNDGYFGVTVCPMQEDSSILEDDSEGPVAGGNRRSKRTATYEDFSVKMSH
ncbi:NAD-dependent malic enzyme 2 [Dirofilaria immitis]